MHMVKGYAARSREGLLSPFIFVRRDLRDNDVLIDVLFCGVCHSDIHTAHGEWDGTVYAGGTLYPCVPGHEIVGRVRSVGGGVTSFHIGDLVAVGTMVDSCKECRACKMGLEQYCELGATWTYNAPDRINGENTYGGYSNSIVVREEFVLKVKHAEKDLAAVAPLLCAGITMWSPLRHWQIGEGKKVGIVGIGGLGHMGIKLAHALGAHVVAFTTFESKRKNALELGADQVVISRNTDEMAAHAGSFDLIVDSVAVRHNLDPFINLLHLEGTMALVGIPAEFHPSPSVGGLIGLRRSLANSLVGGITETQELLDFCAERGVLAQIEIIPIQQIQTAFDRMHRNDIEYRFVIDMQSLRQPVLA
jgi:alcohol dehydrogenase (NADP+)